MNPDLEAIRELLLEIYTAEGVEIWLTSPHVQLGGERALDLIERGDTAPVLALIDQLGSGAFA